MRLEAATVDDFLEEHGWDWPHVNPRTEWACHGTGRIVVVPAFLAKFEALRLKFGRPLQITSGYRSPAHNAAVSSTGTTGPHTTGEAMDLSVRGAEAVRLVYLAIELGFSGFGVKQHGMGRFVHLDTLPDRPGQPRPWLWSYR